MIPYEISVLGDRFLLFSLPSDKEIPSAQAFGERCVILLPSLVADFRVVAYEKCGKPLADYYSAAVCASAHLTVTRGLPLPEISFETPNGNLEILCTGSGLFSVNVEKCKLSSSKNIEICGCEVDICNVFVQGKFCVMRIFDASRFDEKTLRCLVSANLPLPSAVILTSGKNDVLRMQAYSEYNPTPPSSVLTHAAAAYAECSSIEQKNAGNPIAFSDLCSCRVRYSSVFMTVKAIFATSNTKYNDGIV